MVKLTRFAQQFNPQSGILQLMNDLGSTGPNGMVAMLGGGNPAMIPEMEAAFRTEMDHLMQDGRTFEAMIGGYDGPKGNQRFLESLAALFTAAYDWPIETRNLAITNGSQSSFTVLFNLFGGQTAHGQFRHILFPLAPEYIGYRDVALGGTSIFSANRPHIELHGDRFFKYRIDFDQLDLEESVGALCLSRPTNPTGNVVTDEEVQELVRRARAQNLPFILDCAYGQPFPDIVFSDAKPLWNRDIILCMSLSKLGLPGVRTGIVIADEAVIEYITRANAIFSLAPGRFGPTLATRLVESGDIFRLCQEIVRPWYQQRSRLAIEIASDLMSDLPFRIHESEGSIFLWFWFDKLPVDSERLYQRLKARGVYVIAGHHFFPGFETPWRHRNECIRVSYAAPEEELLRGLSVIAEEARKAYEDRNRSHMEPHAA